MRARVRAAGVVVLAACGLAQAHGGDVGVGIANNVLATFLVDEGKMGEMLGRPERVFAGEMGEIIPGFGDQPGFFGEAGTFGGPVDVGFNFVEGLGKWNGNGFDAASETMTFTFGAQEAVLGANPGPGIYFPLGADEFDVHAEVELTPGDNVGIYLLTLELAEQGSLLGASEPFWVVLNNLGDEVEHDVAIEWVEENLVPAPGAIAMLGMIGLGAARRRR